MEYGKHGVLAALFYWAMFNNLNPGLATFLKLQSHSTLTPRNPVLKIMPVSQDGETSDSLISYNLSKRESFRPWVTSLQTFLHDYRLPGTVPQRAQNVIYCDYDQPPGLRHVCDVDVGHWYPCIAENDFNYHRGAPCVFLKLDLAPGWQPVFYNDTNSLPAEMPSDLKSHIINVASRNPVHLNTVWVSCEGENPADVEFVGPIQYVPRRGIPGYYFLNNAVDGYLSPLIALYFERPLSGVLINIKCKAWVRNVNNNNDTVQIDGKFGLLID